MGQDSPHLRELPHRRSDPVVLLMIPPGPKRAGRGLRGVVIVAVAVEGKRRIEGVSVD